MNEWGTPAALFGLLLLLPAAAFGWWRTPRHTLTLATASGLRGATGGLKVRCLQSLPALRLLALALLVVAVAGPRNGEAEALVPAEGIDIVLSFDISSSMTSAELAPRKNRLQATKEVIRDFIKGRENDRIGLTVFQQEALALSPPTLDYAALDKIVAGVESGLLPDGTAIGLGIASALNMIEESTAASRVIVLLTDGEQNAPSIKPLDAAQLAAALNIRIYTIGVGEAQSPRSSFDEELLQEIADLTGAKYFEVGTASQLAAVYDEIGALETSRVGREHFERFDERGPWFAVAAALVLLVDIVLRATWLRRSPA